MKAAVEANVRKRRQNTAFLSCALRSAVWIFRGFQTDESPRQDNTASDSLGAQQSALSTSALTPFAPASTVIIQLAKLLALEFEVHIFLDRRGVLHGPGDCANHHLLCYKLAG